jgi:O-antigen ligase
LKIYLSIKNTTALKLIEKLLFFLFIIAIPIRLWGINYGFYIYAVDFFSILLLFYYFLTKTKDNKYNVFQILLIIHAIWVIIVSLLSVIIYKSDIMQIAKGLMQLLLYDLFFIYFIQKLQNNVHRNFITKLIFYTGIIIVPLSLINFYTNSFFGIDFINDFIKLISIGNLELDDNYLKLTFWIRNSSFAGEPNFLGMYFLFLLQLSLITIRRFFLKQIVAILLLLAILSTFSRAAMICSIIVYLNWTIYFFKQISLCQKIAVYLVVFSSFGCFYFGQIKNNEEFENLVLSVNSRDFSSDNQRLNIFNQAFGIFYRYPFGVGPSNYSVFANKLYGQSGEPNPHNSYLTILVEDGLPGIILMLLLIILLLIKLFNYTNIYYVIGFGVFLLALTINDFYKITGYKFFIFYTFFVFINDIKGFKSSNSLKIIVNEKS